MEERKKCSNMGLIRKKKEDHAKEKEDKIKRETNKKSEMRDTKYKLKLKNMVYVQ